MPPDKYDWSGGNIPDIDVHSLRKHEVLREYLRRYVAIVGGFPFHRSSLTLTLVDAFAGGGLYRRANGELHCGSPLIFLDSVEGAAKELEFTKPFRLDAQYVFLDDNNDCVDFLRKALVDRGYRDRIGRDIFVQRGRFEEEVNNIIARIKSKGTAHRAIFLLDQYGYSDVALATLRRIMTELPKAEILLTFAVDFLIDYLTNSEQFFGMVTNIGFDLDLSSVVEEKRQRNWRYVIQQRLYRQIVEISGARYYTNFFIKSNESNKSYWFLHLSMHEKARDEMQTLHWALHNHFVHEGSAGLDMLGYDPKRDVAITGQPFIFSDYDAQLNRSRLMDQVPRAIPSGGISVGAFLKAQCNQTTANFDQLMDVLLHLESEGELLVFTRSGKKKKPDARLDHNNRVRINTQLRMFFSDGQKT